MIGPAAAVAAAGSSSSNLNGNTPVTGVVQQEGQPGRGQARPAGSSEQSCTACISFCELADSAACTSSAVQVMLFKQVWNGWAAPVSLWLH
jgi:hypothetical protein